MVNDTFGQVVFALLSMNRFLQAIAILAGTVGCGFSLYAVADSARAYRWLESQHLNGLRVSLIKLHLTTHVGILLVQVLLTTISVAAATLPEVPISMYFAVPQGPWIIFVIASRKIMRLLATVILLIVSVYKVRWLHRVK